MSDYKGKFMLLSRWNSLSQRNRSGLLLAIASLLMLLNFVLHYPGTMNSDSEQQYRETLSGVFTDWHPPIMAVVWSWLNLLHSGPQLVLALHLILHWLGFGLLADGLARSGRSGTAWLVLLAGAFPVLVFYNGGIYKDVGMASALVAATGIGAWFRLQRRSIPAVAAVPLILLLTYGTLVRTNAVFALGPLLLFLFFDNPKRKFFATILLSGLITGLALLFSVFVNHSVIGAKSSGAINSLELFDMAGIARESGDVSILPPVTALSIEDVRRCYTPYYWDTFSPWGACRDVSQRLGPADSEPRKEFGKLWVHAILTHPFAYASHRLKAFNSMTYFLVPARHCRYVPGCGTDKPWIYPWSRASPAEMARDIRIDYIKKNFLGWPVTWLALGLAIWLLARNTNATVEGRAGSALLISGWLYLIGYLIVGVASDVRYAYWSIMAIMLAGLLLYPQIRPQLDRRKPVFVYAFLIVGVVLVGGFWARLTNFHSLL